MDLDVAPLLLFPRAKFTHSDLPLNTCQIIEVEGNDGDGMDDDDISSG